MERLVLVALLMTASVSGVLGYIHTGSRARAATATLQIEIRAQVAMNTFLADQALHSSQGYGWSIRQGWSFVPRHGFGRRPDVEITNNTIEPSSVWQVTDMSQPDPEPK